MSESPRIVVFGATGYTGRLTAERLVALGSRPVLAGRSLERLDTLAEALAASMTARADVVRQNSVFALLEEGDVLISRSGRSSSGAIPPSARRSRRRDLPGLHGRAALPAAGPRGARRAPRDGRAPRC
jgi:NAD(P)-dependent dehydrogenase (short-subunit alcohol dehydrogenase family)